MAKRWMVGALVGTMLLLGVAAADAACFGFSQEEMPDAVADYICKYEDVTFQVTAVIEEPGGIVYYGQLNGPDGALIAYMMQVEASDGTLGNIVYFRLPDGTVLLDRRADV